MFIQHGNALACGTIKNIPIPVSPILKCAASPSPEQSDNGSISTEIQESPPYVILLDSGTTVEKSYDDLIQAGRDDASPPKSTINTAALEGIPHFLCYDSKVMMGHKGEFHKGCINYPPEFGFQFKFRRNSRSRKIDFTVPLPDFKQHWTTLLGDNILFPGHSTVRSFLKSATYFKNEPSLNYFSAKNLLSPCTPSLCKSLDPSNPDRQVWLNSYNE